MDNEKIIIIGAVASGSKCAFKLKRLKPDFDIIIYTDEDKVSYSACGLPYFIGGQIKSIENLIIRTPKDYENAGINIKLKHRLTTINPSTKTIQIQNIETDEIFEDTYDKLVLATGASPIIPNINGIDLKNIFTLRTIENGLEIKQAMQNAKNAIIIGGGYIGIELLESFTRNNIKTTLIEASPHIMSLFDDDMAELIETHIKETSTDKVEIITNDSAIEFQGENGIVQKVITKNGKEISADMVVVCVGVKPNTEYIKNNEVQQGIKGTIAVNKRMQTSDENIYAIGDCAEKYNLITNQPCWIPLGSTANKEGRCCAINIAGENDEFPGILGSAVTRFNGFTMSLTGLTEKEAIKNNYDVVTATVTKKDKAGYMPEVKNITIKVIADRKTKKLLGAQAIGCGDADKRVNTVAGAINSDKTIHDLVDLDMTYAPPYSPSIDPLLNALINISQKI